MRPVQCHNIRPVKKLPPDGALFIAPARQTAVSAYDSTSSAQGMLMVQPAIIKTDNA
jgi:hypothetical protein